MDLWSQYSGFLLSEQLYWPSVAALVGVFVLIAYFGLPFLFWVVAGLVALTGFGAPMGSPLRSWLYP